MGPHFESYTYKQLRESFVNVNRQKYPKRFNKIVDLLYQKKPDHIEIIKTPYGYRFLREDQIPIPLGPSHHPRTFRFDTSSDEYLTAYAKASLVVIGIGFIITFRIILDTELHTKIFRIVVWTVIIGGLIIRYLQKRLKGKRVTLTFKDAEIIKKHGDSTQRYKLMELRRIYTNDTVTNDASIDKIEMTFEKGRKLIISSFEPQFDEIQDYLRGYLSDRMNYEPYLDGNSVI
jgi:hypothetical protein